MYLWLMTTASAGISLRVGLYNLDANNEISSYAGRRAAPYQSKWEFSYLL